MTVATPFLTVFLLWRQRKLRQQLLELTELSMEVMNGPRRDLLDVRRQVEASAVTPRPAQKPLLLSAPPRIFSLWRREPTSPWKVLRDIFGRIRCHPEHLARANRLIAQEGRHDRPDRTAFRIEYEVEKRQYLE